MPERKQLSLHLGKVERGFSLHDCRPGRSERVFITERTADDIQVKPWRNLESQ